MAQKELNPEFQKVVEVKDWYKETLANRVIAALEKNNIPAFYAKTKEDAREKALSLIPKGSKVGHGGFLTLAEIGLFDALRNGDYKFIDRRNENLPAEEVEKLRRESLLTDVFVMSTNALTVDGKLYNVDGTGNRVAALAYGRYKVIIVAGINKIVADEEAAVYRMQNYAAPLQSKRQGRAGRPCVTTGNCIDCHSPQKSCNFFLKVEFQRNKRIHVIICGEELGL